MAKAAVTSDSTEEAPGASPSSLPWGLAASAPHGLLDQDLSPSSCCWPLVVPSHGSFAKGQRATWQVASSERVREGLEGEPPRPKPQFCDPVSGVGFPGGSVIKNPPAKGRDAVDGSLIPGSGRSPAGGNGNPLQYSCLENSTDRETRWPTVCEVAKDLETAEHTRRLRSGTPSHLPVLSPRSKLLGPVHVKGRLQGADPGSWPSTAETCTPDGAWGRAGEGLGKGTHTFPSPHLAST